MAYMGQPSSYATPHRHEEFQLEHIPTADSITTTADEPIYYYTLSRGSAENTVDSPIYSDVLEGSKLHSKFRSYDDIHTGPYRRITPWLSPSYEPNAYRPTATIYQSCYSYIDRPQNLTSTFRSHPDDVWLSRRAYYEEEVVIVLREDMQRVGFSMSGANESNQNAIINSILPGKK